MRTLLTTLAMSATAAVVGSVGTRPDSSWYRALDKPSWQPPSIAFPLVWTPLYGLIAYGTARMIDAEPDPEARRRLWALTGVNLAANAGWCWAFFAAESAEAGLASIVALDGLNLALVNEARKRDRIAALALAPYAAWSLFATALNAEILRTN
jgi:tryptophan-rich sensory protein